MLSYLGVRTGTASVVTVIGLLTASAVVVPASAAPPRTSATGAAEPGSRLLQAVDVTMSPSGSVTGIHGQTVEVTDDAADATTSEETYDPAAAADDLPVRVLTSYRTDDGAGTDLSDLDGYTGRVRIDLTVQNTTVRPQVIEYDVDGTSRSRAALVGAPLSIVASAGLDGLDPARVVTEGRKGEEVTNGVLGQDDAGRTTVQWATILAPPNLAATAELSLVVDAQDFDVPALDLSVQPGLVSDPSLGALIDSAFNPASSKELQLQQRTIELVGDVNTVLSRASGTVSDVRSNLTQSAETLGSKTVADLQSSTQNVAGSMRSLDGTITGLQRDLSSSFEATGSSALTELDRAVDAVDRLLGDTSAPVPTAQVDGNGCRTTVADPRTSGSVYGQLLQVAGQLRGYADATASCKGALQASIRHTIGVEKSSDECAGSVSVVCSLLGAEQTFDDIADDLNELTDQAIDLLQPETYADAMDALTALNGNIDTITGITDGLDQGRIGLVRSLTRAVYGPDQTAGGPPGTLEAALGQIDVVQSRIDTVQGQAGALRTKLDSVRGQAAAAADAVCSLPDGTLTPEQEQLILANLVPEDCDGVELDPPGAPGYGSVVERLSDDAELAAIEGSAAEAENALGQVRDDVDRTYTDIKNTLDGGSGPGQQKLQDLIDQLAQVYAELDRNQKDLNSAVGSLETNYGDVADIQQRIDAAVADAKQELGDQLAEDATDVLGAGQTAADELDDMFVSSVNGLDGSAEALTRDGARTLDRQRAEFRTSRQRAGARISSQIDEGLSAVARGVNASTRDLDAAGALLTADLRKVLLDLGERRVGGGGLLGAIAGNAAIARTADYQLALATDKTTSYASVRSRDIAGILLRQGQTDAALRSLAELPAFGLELPAGSQHRTVYTFHVGDAP